MKKILNAQIALFALGVIQPATAREVTKFMRDSFGVGGDNPNVREFDQFLREQESVGRVLGFRWGRQTVYALTDNGNLHLSLRLRKLRDKMRLYLLKDASLARIQSSRAGEELELAGVSPAVDNRDSTEGFAANNYLGLRALGQASYWPRPGKQLIQTGPAEPARDTLPPLISFETRDQATQARGRGEPWSLDLNGLALSLGISAKLIAQIIRRPARHYRTFEIPKRGGGTRVIESPRVFLKLIQRALDHFFLSELRVSDAVHSFRRGRSVVTNALCHEGHRYVANVDIENFFGSVTNLHVRQCLLDNGFDQETTRLIVELATYENHLPQGAPTSPRLSNAVLYGLDERMLAIAKTSGVNYSRYADDMTISGSNRAILGEAIKNISAGLNEIGLRLNDKKTRIASNMGQQRVTGVVVNVAAAPSRERRKLIRVIFYQAEQNPKKFLARVPELSGHIGYLLQFPKLKGGREVQRYRAVLEKLRNAGP